MTRLIVKQSHEMANHNAGTNFMLSQLTGRFCIVAAREEITSAISVKNEETSQPRR